VRRDSRGERDVQPPPELGVLVVDGAVDSDGVGAAAAGRVDLEEECGEAGGDDARRPLDDRVDHLLQLHARMGALSHMDPPTHAWSRVCAHEPSRTRMGPLSHTRCHAHGRFRTHGSPQVRARAATHKQLGRITEGCTGQDGPRKTRRRHTDQSHRGIKLQPLHLTPEQVVVSIHQCSAGNVLCRY